ncbi:IMPACT family protein [bacterium]|nr:IMPACT family protein [bacterium]
MTEVRIIPARRIETEINVKNSRFIVNAAPAFSTDQAQDFIRHITDKYPDATHHVPVYLIGHGSSTIAHCSDDGEPSGTAGRPALAVLKGSGLGDVVIVITRYFGGTKLGTGGLVRAYSDSVRRALEILPRARKVATTTLMFIIPYSLFERTQIVINGHNGISVEENFTADVTLTVRLPNDHLNAFKEHMVELTQGQIEFITIGTRDNTIMPIH